ncbi:L-lysine 6-transaminase [Pelobium manganitolerans]|uniref:L-lysine-epsilon aminotransferase n=1 Tax=Pelobium manganitolerans TaxID=1842495 RepID=A0A419S3Y6_9SPHI|nr:L-lysine 6-transaminase [Pelobium manganitolerans]RKD14367.1 L-lysine 6-transaminase [Pelobium manganitolerans]
MYNLLVAPNDVKKSLAKHVLTDGFDLVYDIKKSKGVRMYDAKHERYLLDFFTCFASVPLGYNHPKMTEDERFKENLLLAAIANPSNSDIYTQQYASFVNTFSEIAIPHDLPHAFFVAGGGLAIENALKTAMDWKVQKNFAKGYRQEKGHKVLHFEHAFHGRTGYTMSLTNTTAVKTKWFAKFDWPRVQLPAVQFPLNDENLDALINAEQRSIQQIKDAFIAHPDEICAIIIEPIQSEGGDNHVRQEFLEQLRILCDANEALLIYDEVQTGVGLSGKFWCFEHFGAKARPDIIAFGKKMQVCGILAGHRVDEVKDNVFTVSSRINSTWGGNLVDMVRSEKILQIIEEDKLCAQAARVGNYLLQQLSALAEEDGRITNARGRGLLCAFDLPAEDFRNRFIAKGLEANTLFLGCGDRSIRFRPALTMEEAHIDEGMATIRKILKNS